MAEIFLERTGMTAVESFHTIHNYIDTKEMILRKGDRNMEWIHFQHCVVLFFQKHIRCYLIVN